MPAEPEDATGLLEIEGDRRLRDARKGRAMAQYAFRLDRLHISNTRPRHTGTDYATVGLGRIPRRHTIGCIYYPM
jgi:hypothetical protein